MTEEEVNKELERLDYLMNNQIKQPRGSVKFDNMEVDDLLELLDLGNKEQWEFNKKTTDLV